MFNSALSAETNRRVSLDHISIEFEIRKGNHRDESIRLQFFYHFELGSSSILLGAFVHMGLATPIKGGFSNQIPDTV